MQLTEGLTQLWQSTGIYNFMQTAMQQVEGTCVAPANSSAFSWA